MVNFSPIRFSGIPSKDTPPRNTSSSETEQKTNKTPNKEGYGWSLAGDDSYRHTQRDTDFAPQQSTSVRETIPLPTEKKMAEFFKKNRS
jgi:hypothetical protein